MGQTNLLQHGARAMVYINGQVLGIVTSFSFTSDTPDQEISGIDIDYPIELGSGRVTTTGSMTVYKLTTDSGAQSYGLTTTPIYTNLQKYVSIQVVERQFDTIIFQSDYVKITSESWSLQTKNLMTGTLSFKAITWTNDYAT